MIFSPRKRKKSIFHYYSIVVKAIVFNHNRILTVNRLKHSRRKSLLTQLENNNGQENQGFIQLEECQAGFGPQRRTSDQAFILHDVISSHARKRKSNEPLFILVLDFSKAFDRVNHKVLFRKLMEKGIGGNLLGTLIDMYTDAKATFLINNTLGETFPVTTGVVQDMF